MFCAVFTQYKPVNEKNLVNVNSFQFVQLVITKLHSSHV